MSIENCQDCDYVSNGAFASDGKCSECHGTGYIQGLLEGFSRSISGVSQKCDTCGGSGKCQTCNGKGYIDTGIFG